MKPFPGHPVTLRDIARQLGISHTTVGLALKNHPRIAESRRAEIQAKAREMGYAPNPAAAALSHHKRNTTVQPVQASIAWINTWRQPDRLRTFKEFDLYWKGAAQEAESSGYHLEEFVVNAQMPFTRLETILLTRGILGLLIPPHNGPPMDWTNFHCAPFSIVRFGRPAGTPPVLSVTAHQTRNAILAFNQMEAKGYQRIGFVGNRHIDWTSSAGFLTAQHRLTGSTALLPLLLSTENPEEHLPLLVDWLKKSKPDAILTDLADLKDMIRQAGYRVPEDIGLAGIGRYDCNIDSGIDQHPEEIGRVAAHALIALINANDRGLPPITSDILVNGTWFDGKDLPGKSPVFPLITPASLP